MCQKCKGMSLNGFISKDFFKNHAENMKKLWKPFGSCLLKSTANPAKLEWKWAGLAVLFSRQFFIQLFRYETIETKEGCN